MFLWCILLRPLNGTKHVIKWIFQFLQEACGPKSCHLIFHCWLEQMLNYQNFFSVLFNCREQSERSFSIFLFVLLYMIYNYTLDVYSAETSPLFRFLWENEHFLQIILMYCIFSSQGHSTFFGRLAAAYFITGLINAAYKHRAFHSFDHLHRKYTSVL